MPRRAEETSFTMLRRLRDLVEFLQRSGDAGALFKDIAFKIYDCDLESGNLASARRKFNRDVLCLKGLYEEDSDTDDDDDYIDDQTAVIKKKQVEGKTRYYLKSGFHFIMPMKLTQDQATALACGLRITEDIVGPFATASGKLWEKLKSKLSNDFIASSDRLMGSTVTVIPIGTPDDIAKRENAMRKVADAIQRGKVVKISYTHGDGTKSSYKLSPYVLSLKYHSWYVIGEADAQQRTVRLDRINSVEVLDEDQPHPCVGDELERLKRAIRLDFEPSRPDALYHVKLRITGSFVQPCMETEWFPGEKKKKQKDGSLLYEVDLKGLEWVTLWIMRALDCMEVLEPAALRDEIDRRVEAYSARRSTKEA